MGRYFVHKNIKRQLEKRIVRASDETGKQQWFINNAMSISSIGIISCVFTNLSNKLIKDEGKGRGIKTPPCNYKNGAM